MKISKLSFLIPGLLALASCGGANPSLPSGSASSLGDASSPLDEASASSPEAPSSNEEGPSGYASAKAIVVYFSATEHTKAVAETVAGHLGIAITSLQPVNPYSSADLNYNSPTSRVSQEHNDPTRHVDLISTVAEGFEEAEYVFLGAPVWWQQPSWVINDFASENDFTGKTVIPFGTSASSSFSTASLQELDGSGTWLLPQRFSSSVSSSSVASWVDSLELRL